MLKYVLVPAVMMCISVAKGQSNQQDQLLLKDTTPKTEINPNVFRKVAAPHNRPMTENHKRVTTFAKSLYYSVPLIGMGILGTTSTSVINKYEIREERNEHFPDFHTKVDNYLIFAPIAAVYSMNALGIKGQHSIGKQTVLLLKSELIMNAIVFPLKTWTHVVRPNDEDYFSFPSGHTAQAFVSAEFLRKEYGATHPWLAVGGYAVATGVAALRMMNNKHWAPDVLAGAGIGILSVNLAYLSQNIHLPLSGKKVQITPTYSGGAPGVYMCVNIGK